MEFKPRMDSASLLFDNSESITDGDEINMRRALGVNRAVSTPGRPDSPWPSDRSPHRRRFVADGDVPVVVVRHHDHSADATALLGAARSVNRLAAVESALKGEQEARQRAERALNEAQAAIRNLQTRLGHAVLAQDEAVAAGRLAEIEKLAAAAALDAERDARQKAEDALRRGLDSRERVIARRGLREAPIGVPERAEFPIKRRGRPQGSKNRLPIARRDEQEAHHPATDGMGIIARQRAAAAPAVVPAPIGESTKRRGRPPGTKNGVATPRVKEPKPVRWW